MFLLHHALIVDMLVDAPETLSIAPIVGVRGSIFAKHITKNMMEKEMERLTRRVCMNTTMMTDSERRIEEIGKDGSKSLVAWACSFRYGYTPFDSIMGGACVSGHRELAEMMIEKGAQNWNRGFLGACYGGHRELMELMIEKGANEFTLGLLGSACRGGQRALVKLMVERGVDDWNNGLIGACEGGQREVAELMIEKGANNLNCGLFHACIRGHPELANLMIANGATVCYRCEWDPSLEDTHAEWSANP